MRVRTIVGPLLCIYLVAPSCSKAPANAPFVVPLQIGEGHGGSYLSELTSAVVDSSNIAFEWVVTYGSSSRLWQCIVGYDPSASLTLREGPTVIDEQGGIGTHGGIEDVTALTSHGLHGVLYSKDNQLLLRWPLDKPARVLTTKHEEIPVSSSGIIMPNGDAVVAALVFVSGSKHGRTLDVVGYRIGADIRKVRLASIVLAPGLGDPIPLLRLRHDKLELGLLLPRDRVRMIGDTEVQGTAADDGQFVWMQLREDLSIAMHRIDQLPADSDFRFANCFATVDDAMTTLVAGMPRLHVLALGTPTVHQLSSPVGLGSLFAVPSAQALSTTDTSAVVAWIDTKRSWSNVSMAEGTKDPTGDGGDIQARIVTQGGGVQAETVPGFPIRAKAQCLQLGTIADRAFVAWAGTGSTGLRVALIPRH